jgi:hypothetical protein
VCLELYQHFTLARSFKEKLKLKENTWIYHIDFLEGTEKMEMGRFISLVGIQRTESCSNFPTEKLAHQLCQHVIGMDPKEVGTPETEEDKQQKAEKLKKIAEQAKAERKAAGIDDDDDFGVKNYTGESSGTNLLLS